MVTVNLKDEAYSILLQAKIWYLEHGENRPLNALLSEAVIKTYGDLVQQEGGGRAGGSERPIRT